MNEKASMEAEAGRTGLHCQPHRCGGTSVLYFAMMAKQLNMEGDWVWGVTKSHEELDEADWEFWRSQTPDARLAATFQASVDAWMLHDGDTLDGIDLKAFGVRKLGTEVEERP